MAAHYFSRVTAQKMAAHGQLGTGIFGALTAVIFFAPVVIHLVGYLDIHFALQAIFGLIGFAVMLISIAAFWGYRTRDRAFEVMLQPGALGHGYFNTIDHLEEEERRIVKAIKLLSETRVRERIALSNIRADLENVRWGLRNTGERQIEVLQQIRRTHGWKQKNYNGDDESPESSVEPSTQT